MELGNHISESQSASRTRNNMDMNLDVVDYSTDATPLTTSVTAPKIVGQTFSCTTEGNPRTSSTAHEFSFSVLTKDLNMPASELPEEAAPTPVFQPPAASVDIVHATVHDPALEPVATSVFPEAIGSLGVLDETVSSALAKHAFTTIQEPVSSPVEWLQEQSSNEYAMKGPSEEPFYNLDNMPAHEPFSNIVMTDPVEEHGFTSIPKEEAPLRSFIHSHPFLPDEKPVQEPVSNLVMKKSVQERSSNDVTEEKAAVEECSNPVTEELVQEPSDIHVTEEKVASEPSSNFVMDELVQETSEIHVTEEQADSNPVTTLEIGDVENELEHSQAPQTEEPFDDMIVLEDGMVVVTTPVVEDVKGEAVSSKLSDSETCLEESKVNLEAEDVASEPIHEVQEECKATLEVKDVAAEPIHDVQEECNATLEVKDVAAEPSYEVQGKEFDVEVPHQQTSDVYVPSGGVEQHDIPPVAEISPDSIKESLRQEKIPLDYSTGNELKECKEENEPLITEQLGKSKYFDQDPEALVSRKVLKSFGKKDYVGDIVSYDPETKWFKVVYEDGDEEDLEKVEVEPILLAPGAAVEYVNKKRSRSSDDDETEDNRSAKRQKKSSGRTPKKSPGFKNQKPQTGSKRKRQESKGPKSTGRVVDFSGNKGKGIRVKKHVRTGKKTKKWATGSAKKSPGKKAKQVSKATEGNDAQVTARKSPGKKANEKTILTDSDNVLYKKDHGKAQKKGQQKGKKKGAATPKKKISKVKKSHRTQKVKPKTPKPQKVEVEEWKEEKPVRGRKTVKYEENQVEDGLKKQTAGTKRKAETEQKAMSRNKRLKMDDENADTGGSGQTSYSKKAPAKEKREMIEDSLHFDQDDYGPGTLLTGRIIRKKFGRFFYNGEVISFDKKSKFYKVRYEDGDLEDLEWSELESLLTSGIKVDEKTKVSKKNTKTSKAVHKRNVGGSKEKGKQHTRSGVATRSQKPSN